MPLVIDRLSLRFGDKWALRDVTLEVGDGTIVGLFGASGAGKSTLLNLLAGAAKPASGSVGLDGRDLTQIRKRDRPTWLFNGREHGIFAAFRQRSADGEAQAARFEKLALAEAKIWLIDSAFGDMDAAQRERCFAVIRHAAADGKIVFFASSDFQQLLDLTDEVAVLDKGEVVQTGTPQQIYDEPASVLVARATGENNLIPARRLTFSNEQIPEFYTIDGGHRLFAQPVELGRLGAINQNVTLAIRPEQISMSIGASFPEDNLLKGVVTAIRPRGSTSLVDFDVGGLTLTSRVFRVVGLNIGDECMLGLPPHRMLILRS